MDDLLKRLKRADIELHAYLDGSKRGNDPQGSLDFPVDEKPTKMQIVPEEPLKDFRQANPAAMERLKTDSIEEAHEITEEPPKPKTRKKVAQTAEHPSGIAEEAN